METPTQRACLNLILEHMPECIRESPLILEIADESMKHIKGGDPLQTLRIRCILQLLTNLAESNEEKWISYLKKTPLENFSNCFFKSHPKIMISILNHCPWGAANPQRSLGIIVTLQELNVVIDGETFLKTALSIENQDWTQWTAYIIRRFYIEGARQIIIVFNSQGIDENVSILKSYEQQIFSLMHTMDYSQGISDFAPDDAIIYWKYNKARATVSFDARANRGKGHRFSTSFYRSQSTPRSINVALKEDFTDDFLQ